MDYKEDILLTNSNSEIYIKEKLSEICNHELKRLNMKYKTPNFLDFEKRKEIIDDENHSVTTTFKRLFFVPNDFIYTFTISISNFHEFNFIHAKISKLIRNLMNMIISKYKKRVISVSVDLDNSKRNEFMINSKIDDKIEIQISYVVQINAIHELSFDRVTYIVHDDGIDDYSSVAMIDISDKLFKLNKDLLFFDMMYNNIDIYLDETDELKNFNTKLNKKQKT